MSIYLSRIQQMKLGEVSAQPKPYTLVGTYSQKKYNLKKVFKLFKFLDDDISIRQLPRQQL